MQEIPWEHRTNCVLQGSVIAPFLTKAQWRGQIANKTQGRLKAVQRRHNKTELRSSQLPEPRDKMREGCIQSVQKTAAKEEKQQIAQLPRRAEQASCLSIIPWTRARPAPAHSTLPLSNPPVFQAQNALGCCTSPSLEMFHNPSQLQISGLETFQRQLR